MGFFDLIKNMGMLELVDEDDDLLGFGYKHHIHKKGLRHRSFGIIITDGRIINKDHKLLISFSNEEFNLPIKDHLKIGQSYTESAYENINRLFSDKTLNLKLMEVAKYKNDYRNDLENTCLFHLIYDGIIEDTKNTQFI